MHATSGHVRRIVTAGLAVLLAAVLSPAPAGASGGSSVSLRLFAAKKRVVLKRFPGDPVWMDVGAYITPVGGTFDLRVTREGYRNPILVTQFIHPKSGPVQKRPLPPGVADGWQGLSGFLHMTIADAQGNVVRGWTGDLCPDSYNPQRVNDGGPVTPTFPAFCSANPFTLGMVWGIDNGWAVDPMLNVAPTFKLPDGQYLVTLQITDRYRRLFGVPASDAAVTVAVVVKSTGGKGRGVRRPASPSGSLTPAHTITNPDPRALPDLAPFPSWGIGIDSQTGHDYLDFGATVWVGGTAPLVVEGFRRPGKNVMDAFQYFYRDGKLLGRARVGTFRFDSAPGHQHWHFEQFARYSLLDSTRTQVLLSQKTGFCIAPTDAVDLTLKHAEWLPGQIGFSICGDKSSIWIREAMPVGWGDTYFQSLPGQSFDITGLPNGTYYIDVQANPLGLLYETSHGNDSTVRKVILGGTPGARTVQVPPWHGIDSEGGCPPVCTP